MFSDEVVKELSAKLEPGNIKERKQSGRVLSYIEGWHAIAEANRIFGYGNWQRDTVETKMVAEAQRMIGQEPYQKEGWGVTYICKVRVSVVAGDGCIFRDGTGAGHGIDGDLGKAHESAIKEAETDAMKRALMTFGNPFGLALYDKDKAGVGSNEPEAPKNRSNVRMVSEINQLKSPGEANLWWKRNEQDILALPEEYQQEVEEQYQQRLKAIEDGSAKPGPFKWENVSSQDAWLVVAKQRFDACDTLEELAIKQDGVQHKINALETKRRMEIIDYILKKKANIEKAKQQADLTKAG